MSVKTGVKLISLFGFGCIMREMGMNVRKALMCGSSNVVIALVVVLLGFGCGGGVEGSVSYDSRAITINGQRRILISGSIHYPRSTPEVRVCVFVLLSPLPPCFFL